MPHAVPRAAFALGEQDVVVAQEEDVDVDEVAVSHAGVGPSNLGDAIGFEVRCDRTPR